MPGNGAIDGLERFEYPDRADAPFVPSWNGWEEAPDACHRKLGEAGKRAASAGDRAACCRLRAASGRGDAPLLRGRPRARIEEGREAERAGAGRCRRAAEEKPHPRRPPQLVEKFARQRDRYFQAVEQEVVKLALAVAARILRREAQTDPLLLMGAVRVALGQLAASTEVRLRVPAADLDLWTEAMALLPNLGSKPAGGSRRWDALGECAIETALGTADLGIPAQLAEMERGFFGAADREAGAAWRLETLRPRSLAVRGERDECAAGPLLRAAGACQPWRWRGQVLESVGQTIESAGPLASVGECCEIRGSRGTSAPGGGDRFSRLECPVHAA